MTSKTQRWKAYITIHKKTGEALGKPIAGSKVFEFETPTDSLEMAEAELRRHWEADGYWVSGPEPFDSTDPNLTSYPNLNYAD